MSNRIIAYDTPYWLDGKSRILCPECYRMQLRQEPRNGKVRLSAQERARYNIRAIHTGEYCYWFCWCCANRICK